MDLIWHAEAEQVWRRAGYPQERIRFRASVMDLRQSARAITRSDEIAPTPSAAYRGSQWAEPLVKSIGSPRELIGLKMKTSLKFVVSEAMNPFVK